MVGETTRRPLFSSTRRPSSPPAPIIRETQPPPPPAPPSVTLEGVVSDQEGMHAFVKSGAPAKTRSLWRGDEIEGWKVVEIGPRSVVFEREARKFTVALLTRRPRPSKIAATPPPQPSSGD